MRSTRIGVVLGDGVILSAVTACQRAAFLHSISELENGVVQTATTAKGFRLVDGQAILRGGAKMNDLIINLLPLTLLSYNRCSPA